jgi:hypothetical protein
MATNHLVGFGNYITFEGLAVGVLLVESQLGFQKLLLLGL